MLSYIFPALHISIFGGFSTFSQFAQLTEIPDSPPNPKPNKRFIKFFSATDFALIFGEQIFWPVPATAGYMLYVCCVCSVTFETEHEIRLSSKPLKLGAQ